MSRSYAMKLNNYKIFTNFVSCLTLCLFFTFSVHANASESSTSATIKTNHGSIELSLYDSRAPQTVKNFIRYANKGFYKNTLFHRVIPNFMIQGGGFDLAMTKKATDAPIKNEANAFIPNLRGTIAMARTNDPHSATSQFFINVKDNTQLNKSNYNAGYAVFGKVTKGMDVADRISRMKTTSSGYMRDVPAEAVIIESITVSEPLPKKKQDSAPNT